MNARSQLPPDLRLRDRGMGPMVLLSLALHAGIVLFAIFAAPRFATPVRPVYFLEFARRPAPPPQAEQPEPRIEEKKPPVAQVPAKRQTAPVRRPAAPARTPAEVVARPAPAAPPPPSAAKERPIISSAPSLPPPAAPERIRAATLPDPLGNVEAKGIGLGRRTARRDSEEPLPERGARFSSSMGPEVAAGSAGGSRARYQDRADRVVEPVQSSLESLGRSKPADTDPGVAPKLAGGRVRERTGSALTPPSEKAVSSFAAPGSAEVAAPAPEPPKRAPAETAKLAPDNTSFDYLDRVAPDDLDRMRLVSLNKLRTCLDPEAEMRLRTRLASRLGRPGRCRTGGVIFDFRQPESAWSIHVDIYNYEDREFPDRCAALRLAVDCCERGRK